MKVASSLDKARVAQFYEQMLLIRRFEEQSGRLYMEGKIRGFCHLYIGQEAVAVGAISALRDDDYVITHYRDHGHALTRGMDPGVVMAELFGKVTGSSRGKGGSMHLFDVSRGFMGGHAIVGGQMPLAVGLALAIKYRKEDRAVICFFGDGAVNEGEFHEALNLAGLWKLPVLFLLENNLYGMGTHIDLTRAGGRDIYQVGDAYSMPSAQIDGMNVMEVREAVEEALERIRSRAGPAFIEAMCYRFVGHSVQDPQFYREKSELEQWEDKDPIKTFRQLAIAADAMTEDELAEIDEQVAQKVAEAVKFADESDFPEPAELFDGIYA